MQFSGLYDFSFLCERSQNPGEKLGRSALSFQLCIMQIWERVVGFLQSRSGLPFLHSLMSSLSIRLEREYFLGDQTIPIALMLSILWSRFSVLSICLFRTHLKVCTSYGQQVVQFVYVPEHTKTIQCQFCCLRQVVSNILAPST